MNLSNFSQIRYGGKDISLGKINGDIIYEKTYIPVDPDGRKLIMTYTIANTSDTHTFNSDFEYVSEIASNGDGTYTINLYANDDFTSFTCNINTLTVDYLAITSKVTNMSHMFYNCKLLTYINTEGWNTSNVTDMGNMFSNCTKLVSLDLSSWDTSNVTNMQSMFQDCSSLTSLDLSNFNTSNVTNMWNMFSNCTSLKSINLEGWDLRKANTQTMLAGCSSLTDLNVKNWKCGNLLGCFINCTSLGYINVSGWNTTETKSMQQLFYGCSKLSKIESYHYIDTSKVTNMHGLFAYTGFIDFGTVNSYLYNWNTSKVTDMSRMFEGCTFHSASYNNFITFKTTSLTDISGMFAYTSSSYNFTIDFDTSNVTDMSSMFKGSTMPIEFNTWPKGDCSHMFEDFYGSIQNMWSGDVTNARYMFANSNITDYEFSSYIRFISLSGCTDTSYMFYNCTGLQYVDMDDELGHSTWSLNDASYMFAGCTNLTHLYIPYMVTANVYSYEGMFNDIPDYASIYINSSNFTLTESDTGFSGSFNYV